MTLWPDRLTQEVWIIAGSLANESEILNEWPAERYYRALHCAYLQRGIPVTSPEAMVAENAAADARRARALAVARRAAAAI